MWTFSVINLPLSSFTGNVTATLVYASPTVTFYRTAKKKDSGSFSPIPYIICLLSASLWTYYAVIKPKGFLIASRCSIGRFPNCLNRRAIKVLVISSIAFIALLLSTLFGSSGDKRLIIIGYIYAINAIISYASPLSIMVPTGTSWLLGRRQLLLYVCYYERTPRKSNGVKTSFETINICTTGQAELAQTFKPEEAGRQAEPC
ncbi:hypothetical protein KP509_11G057100 [Ceratopteris richardii]|uniref:Bidirectional sugar transporter SWEET n=1 Tax=Ceratopteris richardii TaxID=49495 RepID=A0A8T2TRT7_CERRI|nr:hypothetical protein KP509_11G057100 [Ceratopteris richardii]